MSQQCSARGMAIDKYAHEKSQYHYIIQQKRNGNNIIIFDSRR